MNPEDYSRDDLVAASVATPWLMLVAAVLLALWLVSLKWRRRFESREAKNFAAIAGFAIIGTAIWLVFQTAARFLALATAWPLWVLAALGGAAAEAIFGIYGLERRLVTPESRGRGLLGLRLLALAILTTILAQPVRTFLIDREINREVAVLIDDSQSMELSDRRLTATEALDRAALFRVHASENRPPIREYLGALDGVRQSLDSERDALEDAPDSAAALESRGEFLSAAIVEAGERIAAVSEEMETLRKGHPDLPANVRNDLDEIRGRLGGKIHEEISRAAAQHEEKSAGELLKSLGAVLSELEGINARLPTMAGYADSAYYDALSDGNRDEVLKAASRPRVDIARELLRESKPRARAETKQGAVADLTLLSQLKERYNLRFYQFAREPRELVSLDEAFAAPDSEETGAGGAPSPAATSLTDLTSALEHVLDNTSPEALAGVLLLSDGRHNGPVPPEDSLRQLAVQNSPLCAVAIGGNLGPIDASILSVTAPESIYLGDRVLVKAGVKLDGLRGQQVKARLKYQGEVVDEQTIGVPDVSYRTELRFVHMPEGKGVFDYQVELAALEKELFSANNTWDFKVAVTDDRTNVLLVDGVPRWEFRYLRNLFYGRDKSVHLQYVLLRPDEIEGLKNPSGQPASATRKFGDAEADSLPRGREEWQLFDVIILGDIPPASLGPLEWGYIREGVTERGATLVCIGGPRYMPHAFDNETLRDLLPVTYEHSDEKRFESPEDAYRLELTTAGRGHPVMAQSPSRALNAQIWGRMPDLRWRTVPSGVKEGAEVLAYARPLDGSSRPAEGVPEGSPDSIEAAILQLANQKELEKKNALIAVQRAGLGKVVMMNFDRTWRFRYGVGDTYHHRFWGQLLRWCAGQNLRSGTETVRLGTDRLTYTPSDPVEILAKVLDADRRPVTDAEVFASIYLGEERILRQKMSYRTATSGLYETSLAPLSQPGEYTIRLEGDAVGGQTGEGKDAIETTLLVVATRNPIELAELTADRDFLHHAAQATGGKAVEITEAPTLASLFGAPKEVLTERRNITLWDKWPLLVMFLGLLTTEWLIRRRSGLA